MKQEAQQIAIAEACGFEWFRWGQPKDAMHFLVKPRENNGSFVLSNRPDDLTGARLDEVPKYPTDLNAMHGAVAYMQSLDRGARRWTAQIQGQYVEHLISAVTRANPDWMCRGSVENCIEATAAQRAEAFLRTIGKWVEE